jgi:hypothetical protein
MSANDEQIVLMRYMKSPFKDVDVIRNEDNTTIVGLDKISEFLNITENVIFNFLKIYLTGSGENHMFPEDISKKHILKSITRIIKDVLLCPNPYCKLPQIEFKCNYSSGKIHRKCMNSKCNYEDDITLSKIVVKEEPEIEVMKDTLIEAGEFKEQATIALDKKISTVLLKLYHLRNDCLCNKCSISSLKGEYFCFVHIKNSPKFNIHKTELLGIIDTYCDILWEIKSDMKFNIFLKEFLGRTEFEEFKRYIDYMDLVKLLR